MYDEPGILTDRVWSGSRSRGTRIGDYRLPIRERTVSDMTPSDVRTQAQKKIEQLAREIESTKQRLADAEAELKFWESVK